MGPALLDFGRATRGMYRGRHPPLVRAILTGPASDRQALLVILAQVPLPGLTHSVYEPLQPLLRDLAAVLVVDGYWLDESET